MLNAAQTFLQDILPAEQKRGDYKSPHAPRGTPPRPRWTEPGARAKAKRAARAAVADAVIENRDNPASINPRYLNSCPARRNAAPWPEKAAPHKRKRSKKPRKAATYRAAKRNAMRARQRAARQQRQVLREAAE